MLTIRVMLICVLAGLCSAAREQATVKNDSEPVYSLASTTSPLVNYLKQGDVVTVDFVISGTVGKWCGVATVKEPVTAGYVPCDHLNRTGSPKAVLRRATPEEEALEGRGEVDPARTAYNEGLLLLERGEAAKAIASFDAAIRAKPDDAAPYYQRGRARQQLGKYESAIEDFTEAIQHDRTMAAAFNERATAHRA